MTRRRACGNECIHIPHQWPGQETGRGYQCDGVQLPGRSWFRAGDVIDVTGPDGAPVAAVVVTVTAHHLVVRVGDSDHDQQIPREDCRLAAGRGDDTTPRPAPGQRGMNRSI